MCRAGAKVERDQDMLRVFKAQVRGMHAQRHTDLERGHVREDGGLVSALP